MEYQVGVGNQASNLEHKLERTSQVHEYLKFDNKWHIPRKKYINVEQMEYLHEAFCPAFLLLDVGKKTGWDPQLLGTISDIHKFIPCKIGFI